MACRRCSLHGIDYPTNYNRCAVPDCDETLAYFSNERPDPDFKDMVAYYTHLGEDNEVEEFRDELIPVGPRVINQDSIHLGALAIPDLKEKPSEHGGQLWVAHEDLIRAGYLYLEDFGVIRMQGKFYELQGHVGRASLSHGIRGGAWWIAEINPNITCPDHYYFPEGGE